MNNLWRSSLVDFVIFSAADVLKSDSKHVQFSRQTVSDEF